MPTNPGNSAQEQDRLRAAALWAADCATAALALFEARHPEDARPRKAIEAALAFARGGRRDRNLRLASLEAMRAGQERDKPSRCAAKAATLVASMAYTHTDLRTGLSGIRQARHLLGPIVFAALAQEVAGGGEERIGDEIVREAVKTAPEAVRELLALFPRQPGGKSRSERLFRQLDEALRS